MADSEVTQDTTAPKKAALHTRLGADKLAWQHLGSHVRLWPVAAICLVVDLWTKHWAFTHLSAEPTAPAGYVIIPHVMSLRRSLNAGALFGLGKGLTPVFIVASVLALLFVVFLFVHSSRHHKSLHVGLALVLAGALGNLYDRAFVQADIVRYTVDGRTYTEAAKVIEEGPQGVIVGAWPDGSYRRLIPSTYSPEASVRGVVRDFIKMEPRFTVAGHTIEIWPWVFNIADVWLVVGVGLLMLNFWLDHKAERRRHRQAENAASSKA